MDAIADDDAGFGLAEIVVSMLILTLVALSLLPLLIAGIKQAASNTTMATATSLVQSQVAQATGASPTCSALLALGAATWTTTDARGVELEVSRTVGACPTTYPGTVAFGIAVVRASDDKALSAANTLLYVEAAS